MTAERAGRTIAIASMLVSAALAAAKITVGLHANSTAVVSDGLESAGDVLTSGLVLFGLMIAAKPPDAEHPYGHGRLETLSALVVGMMLIATGSLISFRSLQRAWEPQHTPAAYAIWPLIASIAIKSVMSFAKWRYGRKIRQLRAYRRRLERHRRHSLRNHRPDRRRPHACSIPCVSPRPIIWVAPRSASSSSSSAFAWFATPPCS